MIEETELFNDASKDINRNKHLQRVWNNYMNRFMGELKIPLYNKLKHYNFYDTLESLLTRMFNVSMENNDVKKREKLEALEGQDIMTLKWGDRMYKEVLDEYNVNDFEPVQIDEVLEVNSCDFQTVLNRLNTKAEEEKIQILDKMFEIKANKTKKLKDKLEIFNGYIITSNELVGARTIVKHLKKKLEHRRKKQRRMTKILHKQLSMLSPNARAAASRSDAMSLMNSGSSSTSRQKTMFSPKRKIWKQGSLEVKSPEVKSPRELA